MPSTALTVSPATSIVGSPMLTVTFTESVASPALTVMVDVPAPTALIDLPFTVTTSVSLDSTVNCVFSSVSVSGVNVTCTVLSALPRIHSAVRALSFEIEIVSTAAGSSPPVGPSFLLHAAKIAHAHSARRKETIHRCFLFFIIFPPFLNSLFAAAFRAGASRYKYIIPPPSTICQALNLMQFYPTSRAPCADGASLPGKTSGGA